MSSHHIFVQCRECKVTDQLYTGDEVLEHFTNDSFELNWIEAICDDCEGEN